MGRKLYVGNLSFNTGDDELKLAFSQCGSVEEAKIIIDRESGRSRGFGFVTMSSDSEAQAAIQQWNGNNLSGRPLVVNEAKERQGAGGGGGRPRHSGGGGGGFGGGFRSGGPPPDPDRKGERRRGGRRNRSNDYD